MTGALSKWRYRLLLVIVAIIATIAVGTGLFAMAAGPVTSGQAQHVAVSTDSEYRFLNGLWAAFGAACWWALRQPVQRSLVIAVFLCCAFAGGVARSVSWLVAGYPGPVFVASLAVELVVVPVVGGLLAGELRRVRAST